MKETLNQTIDYLNHMSNGKRINTEKLMDTFTLIKEQRNYFIEDLPEMNINRNIPQQDLKKKSYIGSCNVKIYLDHDPFYLLRAEEDLD